MSEKEWKFPYNVRYEILDPNIIFNFVGRKITKPLMEECKNRGNMFYIKLEESILKDGFLNPICVAAGWGHDIDAKIQQEFIRKRLPPKMQEDDSKILMCDRNGGSRLFFAKKHNLKVPCIITDYVNRFPNSKTLYSADEIKAQFTHPPKYVKFDSRGVLILIPHQLEKD